MIYAGIDPGKAGALALLDAEGRVLELVPMPVLAPAKGRAVYDLAALVDNLARWRTGGVFVTVERLHPMPPKMPGGSIANFERGVSSGFVWMLAALKIPHTLVTPQTWQKRMLEGTAGKDTKQRAIVAAQRLFPGVDLRRTPRGTKPHDGIADALLLAEYGRRSARPSSFETAEVS